MKTTLNLNDTLYRRAKIKAFEQGRTVSELIEECLQIALSGNAFPSPALERVPLPLIESVTPISHLGNLTPHHEAGILIAQEATWATHSK